jgi:hypothetical protein
MRHLLLTLAVLAVAVVAYADDAAVPRTTIGDVPRTYIHFMNAKEAALCRANAGAGGLSAYFFNPAVIGGLDGISGMATLRVNSKSRDYLPTEGPTNLEASDDAFLFSQAVAAKRDGSFAFGMGYSCPSYRHLEITGTLDGSPYSGEFGGSLRFFELVGSARIGSEGKGVVGAAFGIATLEESARESSTGRSYIRTAEMDGKAASLAIGMTYDVSERLVLGAGYRFATVVDVEGEWHTEEGSGVEKGTTKTEPVAVIGARFAPIDVVTIYATYMNEGWNKTSSSFAPYYEITSRDGDEASHERSEFDDALSTVALGAEVSVAEGRVTLRGGYSMPVGADFSNDAEPEYRELVPEYALGLGATLGFNQYAVDAAFVHESYSDGDEGGQATNNGVYLSVGYDF